ncbi:glycogen debranching protein [Thioclava dalianensis]|uniref:Glycogen debranching protein n=1 Tax=Thioclava dalianensis TaxID=1185766 RepID=A0A074TRB4_9RHOB|nr:glycogen debranching protein GlgX [Thioclava dalianensis]KEP71513.1 glycogen debranching protein [Thioclava dalianensis]SFN64860.1 glycogen operon protein [Thioclava dalianensis]
MKIEAGQAGPLGATLSADGVNFAVTSEHAERIELCLFEGEHQHVLDLPRRSGPVWHGFVPGLREGARYGFRAHGPWAPEEGHRFNPAKLLIDPYARALDAPPVWQAAMAPGKTRPDPRDSGPVMPKSIVCAAAHPDWQRPGHAWQDSVIYEAHPKGLTMEHPDIPEVLRGTWEGLASDPILAHLNGLGVTAIELLPSCAFIDDKFLVEKGLRNYWGYQPVGFFAPEPRYCGSDPRGEFQRMVQRFHGAGIEVILDVVFNHTGEGDARGPVLSLRGLDNASYYRLTERGAFINETGTGNTLDLSNPLCLRLVMDCLRYWVTEMGVDGFRFDLASTLARGVSGAVEPRSAFLSAVTQDPVLSGVKLIAEPWDIGPGGYFLGGFPHPFCEWNDRFRDDLRKFWRGDAAMAGDLARRVAGSAEIFDHHGRLATASVNFLTAHDGFTLQDLVSYDEKKNEANGEGNRDGHGENHSQALSDPEAQAARKRALLASLLLSQGVPMLLAGDELGNSQGGNNNAYAQDNAIGWVNWREADAGLIAFTRRLIALRAAHPVLRQTRFLHALQRAQDGLRDLVWRLPSGEEPSPSEWNDPELRCIGVEIRGAAEGLSQEAGDTALYLLFNAGAACEARLPPGDWALELDTADPGGTEPPKTALSTCLAAQSVQLFRQRPAQE